MIEERLQHTFVILTDWRGHVVWTSKFDALTKIGELAWSHLTPDSKQRAAEAHARVASLRRTESVTVVNVSGEHFRLWMWPLDTPEIAVCALGLQVPPELCELTDREMTCLQMLATGMPVAEIATRLDVSVSTVHTHLKRSREALGIDNLEALISFAARYCYPPEQALVRTESA